MAGPVICSFFFPRSKSLQYACISNKKEHNCENPYQSALLCAVYQPPEMWYIPPPALRKWLGPCNFAQRWFALMVL